MFYKRESFHLGIMILLIIATNFSTISFSATSLQKSKAKNEFRKVAKISKKTAESEPAGKVEKATARPTPPETIGSPALFQDRGDISSLDLFWGMGNAEEAPKPPFTFDKEDTSGTNPKIKVRDANGVRWNVKFDEEVHAEVAASRIVWASGYQVEESYYLASGQIKGVKDLRRARPFVGVDGSFKNAMFEKRPPTVARRNRPWSWTANPFSNTKEFSGLVMLAILLNNWDTKDTNNEVLGMDDAGGTGVREWYIVSDWGGSLGKSGSFFSHNKWNLKDYAKQKFIAKVSKQTIEFNYGGVMSGTLEKIPVDHVKWFAGILGQLSEKQLQDAFQAAGANDEEVIGFASAVKHRIDQLMATVK